MLPELEIEELKPLPPDIKLRDVQIAMFNNLAKNYASGYRRPIICAITGAGKTIWTAFLFHKILNKNPEARLLFVVPRVKLLNQTHDVFKEVLGIDAGVIRGIDERFNLSKQIQIATIQTLSARIKNNPTVFGLLNFDCAVIDEAHLVFEGIKDIQADWFIGLTGTPYTKGLGKIYDSLVPSLPFRTMVENGIVTEIRVMSCQKQVDQSKLSITSTGEFNAKEEEEAVNEIIGDVVKEWENNPDMRGRPFLGFAKNISSCVSLAKAFQEKGHNVGYIHSKMSDKDRDDVLTAFEEGLLVGVFSINTLCEGYDYPEASALLLCTAFAPSKDDPSLPNAMNRYAQMIGRVRRSCEGKDYALIHDHGNNYIQYGHPDSFETDKLDDGKRRKSKPSPKKKPKPTVCPECNSYVDRGNKCSFCGHILKKYTEIIDGEVVHFVDGKMVEVKKPKTKRKKKGGLRGMKKQEIYSGVYYEYIRRNKYRRDKNKPPMKPGWIAYKYREITGVWPRGLKQIPVKNKAVSGFITYSNIRRSKAKQ